MIALLMESGDQLTSYRVLRSCAETSCREGSSGEAAEKADRMSVTLGSLMSAQMMMAKQGQDDKPVTVTVNVRGRDITATNLEGDKAKSWKRIQNKAAEQGDMEIGEAFEILKNYIESPPYTRGAKREAAASSAVAKRSKKAKEPELTIAKPEAASSNEPELTIMPKAEETTLAIANGFKGFFQKMIESQAAASQQMMNQQAEMHAKALTMHSDAKKEAKKEYIKEHKALITDEAAQKIAKKWSETKGDNVVYELFKFAPRLFQAVAKAYAEKWADKDELCKAAAKYWLKANTVENNPRLIDAIIEEEPPALVKAAAQRYVDEAEEDGDEKWDELWSEAVKTVIKDNKDAVIKDYIEQNESSVRAAAIKAYMEEHSDLDDE